MARLQSAMEYMVTNMWMVLVVVLVIGALWLMGVFSPSNYAFATGCTLPSNFGCTFVDFNTNGILSIAVSPEIQTPINITSIGCGENSTYSNTYSYLPPIYYNLGANHTLSVQCYLKNNLAYNSVLGGTFDGYIFMNYTNIADGQNHELIGTVIAKVETVGVSKSSAPVGSSDLGSAATFGLLTGGTINSLQPVVVFGNVGATAESGGAPTVIGGTNYIGGATYANAMNDLTSALKSLPSEPCTYSVKGSWNLRGQTLLPGVYCIGGSATITKTLTLSGSGNYLFLIQGSLSTGNNANIVLQNGADPYDVIWVPNGAWSIGHNNQYFQGYVITKASGTMQDFTNVIGGVQAKSSLSVQKTVITVPSS